MFAKMVSLAFEGIRRIVFECVRVSSADWSEPAETPSGADIASVEHLEDLFTGRARETETETVRGSRLLEAVTRIRQLAQNIHKLTGKSYFSRTSQLDDDC